MTVRLYLDAVVGAGVKGDPRRPAHLDLLGSMDWSMIDYGAEPICLLGLVDPTASVHNALVAQSDVTAVPANLDTQVGANVQAARDALENRNLPGSWVQGTDTWRTIVHTVGGCFLFFQRCNGLGLSALFSGAVTLGTRWNQLPAATRQTLLDAATSFGYDTSQLSGATTLRTILKALADQWGSTPIHLAGETI